MDTTKKKITGGVETKLRLQAGVSTRLKSLNEISEFAGNRSPRAVVFQKNISSKTYLTSLSEATRLPDGALRITLQAEVEGRAVTIPFELDAAGTVELVG